MHFFPTLNLFNACKFQANIIPPPPPAPELPSPLPPPTVTLPTKPQVVQNPNEKKCELVRETQAKGPMCFLEPECEDRCSNEPKVGW